MIGDFMGLFLFVCFSLVKLGAVLSKMQLYLIYLKSLQLVPPKGDVKVGLDDGDDITSSTL